VRAHASPPKRFSGRPSGPQRDSSASPAREEPPVSTSGTRFVPYLNLEGWTAPPTCATPSSARHPRPTPQSILVDDLGHLTTPPTFLISTASPKASPPAARAWSKSPSPPMPSRRTPVHPDARAAPFYLSSPPLPHRHRPRGVRHGSAKLGYFGQRRPRGDRPQFQGTRPDRQWSRRDDLAPQLGMPTALMPGRDRKTGRRRAGAHTLTVRTSRSTSKPPGVDEGTAAHRGPRVPRHVGRPADPFRAPLRLRACRRPGRPSRRPSELLDAGESVAQYRSPPATTPSSRTRELIGTPRRLPTGLPPVQRGLHRPRLFGRTMGRHTDQAIQDFPIDAVWPSIPPSPASPAPNSTTPWAGAPSHDPRQRQRRCDRGPLRIARAVSGQASADAPDWHDRAYHLGNRPPRAHPPPRPMLGVTVGRTVA